MFAARAREVCSFTCGHTPNPCVLRDVPWRAWAWARPGRRPAGQGRRWPGCAPGRAGRGAAAAVPGECPRTRGWWQLCVRVPCMQPWCVCAWPRASGACRDRWGGGGAQRGRAACPEEPRSRPCLHALRLVHRPLHSTRMTQPPAHMLLGCRRPCCQSTPTSRHATKSCWCAASSTRMFGHWAHARACLYVAHMRQPARTRARMRRTHTHARRSGGTT